MSLQGCVASLAASCNLLQSSLSTLDIGTSDFPRLSSTLANTRHFELLPESHIISAQSDLRSEIGPQRDELLRRAEKGVQVLERREYSLKSKRELQQVRLSNTTAPTTAPTSLHTYVSSTARYLDGKSGARNEHADSEDAQRDRLEKLRTLKAKRERLAYSLKRKQMEEQGRKTRMSLATSAFLDDRR